MKGRKTVNWFVKRWKLHAAAYVLCLLAGLMMLPCCAALADEAQEEAVLVLPAPDVYLGLADWPAHGRDDLGPIYWFKVVVYPEESMQAYAALLTEKYGLIRKEPEGSWALGSRIYLVDAEGNPCLSVLYSKTRTGNMLMIKYGEHCATAALETLDSPKDVIPETEAHWRTCDSCDGQMMCLECEGWGETLLLPFIEPLLPYIRPLQLLAWTVDCKSCKDGQCPNRDCVNGKVFNPPDEDELALDAYMESIFEDPRQNGRSSRMTVTAQFLDPATNEPLPALDGMLAVLEGTTTQLGAVASNPMEMSLFLDDDAQQLVLACVQRNGDWASVPFEAGERAELGDIVLTPFDPEKPHVKADAVRHEDGTVTYSLELVNAPDAQIHFVAAEYAADVPAGSLDRVLYNRDEQFTGEGFALTDTAATESSVTFTFDGTQVELLRMRLCVDVAREPGAQRECLRVYDEYAEDGLRFQLDMPFGDWTSYHFNLNGAAPQEE